MGTPTPASIAPKRPTFTIACWLFAICAFAQLMAVGVAIAARVGETREVVRYIKEDPLIVSVPTIRDDFTVEDNSTPRSIEQLLEAYGESSPSLATNPTVDSAPDLLPEPALKTTPAVKDPEVEKLLNDAYRLHIAGDIMNAIIKLEEAEARAPSEPTVYFRKAQLFEDMGQWEKATDNYHKLFEMGPSIGVYYHKAAFKLSNGIDPESNQQDLLVIGPILKRESDDGLGVRLTIPIRSNPEDTFDPQQLEVKVHHYDLVDNKRVEPVPPSRAGNIHTYWISDTPNWETQEEIAESFYTLPPLTAADSHIFGARKYFGYVAELYYKNELIDQQAHPRRLHAKHASRQFAPQFDEPFDMLLDDPLPNINPDNLLLPALPQKH